MGRLPFSFDRRHMNNEFRKSSLLDCIEICILSRYYFERKPG